MPEQSANAGPGSELWISGRCICGEPFAVAAHKPYLCRCGSIMNYSPEAAAMPGSEYPRVGWGPSGLYKDGQKISDVPLDEALAVNAAALGGPGSPLTDAELDAIERRQASLPMRSVEAMHSDTAALVAEIRRLRAQVADLSDQKQRQACYILDYVPRSVALAAVQEALAHGRREGETPLAWTKEPPTVAGWYWWRRRKHGVVCAEVFGQADALMANDPVDGRNFHIPDRGGEWAGPIRPPA